MDFVAEFRHWEKKISQIEVGLSPSLPPELSQQELISHIRKFPSICLLDIYKFITQGICGWYHLSQLGNLQHLKDMLIAEMASAEEPCDSDELFELLDRETEMGRVNLRLWKNTPNFTTEDLWNLMLESNSIIPDSSLLFLQRWKFVQECFTNKVLLIKQHPFEFIEKWLVLVNEMVKKTTMRAIPLVSHSTLFRTTYSPQYRLVTKSILEAFLRNVKCT
jgi:hypothetical protein